MLAPVVFVTVIWIVSGVSTETLLLSMVVDREDWPSARTGGHNQEPAEHNSLGANLLRRAPPAHDYARSPGLPEPS